MPTEAIVCVSKELWPTLPTREDVSISTHETGTSSTALILVYSRQMCRLIVLATSDHLSYRGTVILSQLPAGLNGA